MKRFLLILSLLSLIAAPASADEAVDLQIQDNSVTAQIQVSGTYACSLRITFENVIGLTQDSISITAAQVSPLDAALIQRIGEASLFNIPAAFPVLINVSPTPQSALSFTGVYEIEVSTSNLPFDAKFRLFTSPNGGSFNDITTFAGIGSYRVRGTSGDFSDFLIVLDLRAKSQVVNLKFSNLQNALTAHASRIAPETLATLQAGVNNALGAYQGGNKDQAIAHLQEFISSIQSDNGNTIPNSYRANDPNTVNVAGDLRKHAVTLIFSLKL